jgi:hypothetical protein
LLAAALLLTLAVGEACSARAAAHLAADRLAAVRADVVAGSARLRALEARARGEAQGLLPAADALPAQIVADVAETLPRDVRLERLSSDSARGGALELHVVARDAAAWDLLLERLERAPRFRDVQPGPESRDAEVRSVIRARWVEGAR